MAITKIFLRRGKEESLQRRHPWIFSGAIYNIENADSIAEGDIVDLYSAKGDFLARGHYQIGSIAVRVLTFEQQEINAAWWQERIASAYDVRRTLGLTECGHTTCYRLIHGEGDNLPGLVVDIYGSVAVVQCHSVGMYRSRQQIAEAIVAVFGDKITAVYDKSAQTVPFKANLNPVDGYLYGSAEKDNVVLENGHKFLVNWEEGQKTGFFIDQRFNRELVKRYAAGRTVLNTFCYTGGFSVYALRGGAKLVHSVDVSQKAIDLVRSNVAHNFGENAPHEAFAEEAFEFMAKNENKYDLIVLDPPAFAKHRDAVKNALRGYQRLNAKGIQSIRPGGILFTFSCSQAIDKEMFRLAVFSAAAQVGRRVRILHQLHQPADHPINIYHPEGEYLKGLVLEVE